jgi:nucleotide-binding universal stress UspA family protein
MIRDMVAHLSVGSSRDVAMDFAISVATRFTAHVAGIGFVYEPVIPMSDRYGIPADVIVSQRIENQRAAEAALSAFAEAARRAAVSAESRSLDLSFHGAPTLFARLARRFDLSIVAQPEPGSAGPEQPMLEAALFDTGRPVLVVPYIQRSGLRLERVMLCWDGSRSAARAAADAMPFLVHAGATEIVVVETETLKSDELPGADIAQHLARHGVRAELTQIVAVETDVTNALLSHASDSSADLLVMGGYGHSRLREFILGGVTRGILSAMTIPTLMSH